MATLSLSFEVDVNSSTTWGILTRRGSNLGLEMVGLASTSESVKALEVTAIAIKGA